MAAFWFGKWQHLTKFETYKTEMTKLRLRELKSQNVKFRGSVLDFSLNLFPSYKIKDFSLNFITRK